MKDNESQRGRNGVDRRTMLKQIAAGTVSIGSVSGTAMARRSVPDEVRERLGQLEDRYRTEVDPTTVVENGSGEVLELLASPVDQLPVETEVANAIREAVPGDRLVEAADIGAFESEGGPTITYNERDGALTAHLLVARRVGGVEIELAVEPEAGRQYALVHLPSGERTLVVDPDRDVSISAPCIQGETCKYQGCHEPCTVSCCPRCVVESIYCCGTYCYWGGAESGLCSCPATTNCEDVCS